MTSNATQVLNNIKRSFNKFLGKTLEGSTVNFDEDTFVTEGLDSWYVVRYGGCISNGTGMGNLVEESALDRGFYHTINAEIAAYHSNDPQKYDLGAMVDELLLLAETPSIPLYDFTDLEDPDESGTIYISPGKGTFAPAWSGGGKNGSAEEYRRREIVGFILDIRLSVLVTYSA